MATPIFDEYLRRIAKQLPEQSIRTSTPFQQLPIQTPPLRMNVLSYDPLKGVPVIVLGRDPPFIGHYLGHIPVQIEGRWYWRILCGYYEIWAQVVAQDGTPVAYYPAIVNGMVSIGAFAAWQHARDIGGAVRYVVVGIHEPIDEVMVPVDSILFLEQVMQGRLRLLICDPSGVTKLQDYEVAKHLYAMGDLLRAYAQTVHTQDRELRMLRTMLSIKDIEVSKYKSLIDELVRDLYTLAGTVDRLRAEIEQLRTELEYWREVGTVRAAVIASLVSRVRTTEEQIAHMQELVTRLLDLVTRGLGVKVVELERKMEEWLAPPKPEVKPEAKPGGAAPAKPAGPAFA